MLKFIHNFVQRAEGHVFIEFALVLPPMLLLTIGTIEYCMIMFASAVLEGATNYAARVGQTGYYDSSANGAPCAPTATQVANDTSIQLQSMYIVCMAGQRVMGMFDTTKLQIIATDYGSYNSTDTPVKTSCSNSATATATSNPPSCSSLQNFGSAGDVVVYTLTYPYQIITPFMQNIIGTNGVVTLSSSAVVKNEPYNTSGASR